MDRMIKMYDIMDHLIMRGHIDVVLNQIRRMFDDHDYNQNYVQFHVIMYIV
jgi:hypothetical protein